MIDWESKAPIIHQFRGKISGPQLAKKIDVSIHSLRYYCQQRGISLQLKGKPSRFLEKKKPAKRKVYRAPADRSLDVVKLSFDVDSIWHIPAVNFNKHYVSNFT